MHNNDDDDDDEPPRKLSPRQKTCKHSLAARGDRADLKRKGGKNLQCQMFPQGEREREMKIRETRRRRRLKNSSAIKGILFRSPARGVKHESSFQNFNHSFSPPAPSFLLPPFFLFQSSGWVSIFFSSS